jgi:hypothetical protein
MDGGSDDGTLLTIPVGTRDPTNVIQWQLHASRTAGQNDRRAVLEIKSNELLTFTFEELDVFSMQ